MFSHCQKRALLAATESSWSAGNPLRMQNCMKNRICEAVDISSMTHHHAPSPSLRPEFITSITDPSPPLYDGRQVERRRTYAAIGPRLVRLQWQQAFVRSLLVRALCRSQFGFAQECNTAMEPIRH